MSNADFTPYSMTPEEYLLWEAQQTERHEYLQGAVRAMSGGSWNHTLLCSNLLGEVRTHLKGTPCRCFSQSHRVEIEAGDAYLYPDVAIVCGEPLFGRQEALLNPVVVFEVLSPSTERYDRTRKFRRYQTLQSLQEYVLVYQDTAQVEVFQRGSEEGWSVITYRLIEGREASLEIESVGILLPLREVYEGVELLETPPEGEK